MEYTLNDYTTGKVEVGKRQGPPPVLRKDEEQCLVNWEIEMNKIVKKAWLDTVKARSIVNGFAGSGIFPVNAAKVGIKASPSNIFCNPNATSPQDSSIQCCIVCS